MKKFKLPLIALLTAGLLTIAFIGCKKDLKSPTLTSNSVVDQSPNFVVSISSLAGTNGCYSVESNDFTITANAYTPGNINPPGMGGSITITESLTVAGVTSPTGRKWTTSGYNETISPAPLSAGDYSYAAEFDLGNNQFLSMTLPVTVTETCSTSCDASNVLIAKELDGYYVYANNVWTLSYYAAVFHMNLCSDISFVNPLKLQGGLTAGTTPTGSYNPADGSTDNFLIGNYAVNAKPTNKNWTINWIFSVDPTKLPASRDFTVYFTKDRTKYPDDNMTGAWSLKDKNGTLLGQYTSRLLYSKMFSK